MINTKEPKELNNTGKMKAWALMKKLEHLWMVSQNTT